MLMVLIVVCFYFGVVIDLEIQHKVNISSGYVLEKEYNQCRFNLTIVDGKPYCNGQSLSCRVVIGDWVVGKFHQSVMHYNDDNLCAKIKINDYIPYLGK
jgi:hypothetical protein